MSVRLSFGKINIWSRRMTKAHSPPVWWASCNQLKAWTEQKGRCSCCWGVPPPAWLRQSFLSLDSSWNIGSSWVLNFSAFELERTRLAHVQALGIKLNDNHRLSPGWQEILGLPSRHNCMSQFLTNPPRHTETQTHTHTHHQFCFSKELWLIHSLT